MKTISQNKIGQSIVMLITVMCSLSLNESTFCTKLSAQQQSNSVQFQLLNGSNRIAEARYLLSVIINDKLLVANDQNKSNIQYSTFNIQNYSFSDLKKIFGNPSLVNEEGSLSYIYDYTNNKSFTINYNKQNQKTELTIYN